MAQRLIAVPLAGVLGLCEPSHHYAQECEMEIGGFPAIHAVRAQTHPAGFIALIVLSSVSDRKLIWALTGKEGADLALHVCLLRSCIILG